jgi:GNAT superfamily N-acetyltransferase
MEACRDELSVDASMLGSGTYQCFVAAEGDAILGYYSLEDQTQGVYELDALFVDPPHIGTGVGRSLIQHAVQNLVNRNATRLLIQGDPHAVDFYAAAGAKQIGTRASESIPGRDLPLFEILIDGV